MANSCKLPANNAIYAYQLPDNHITVAWLSTAVYCLLRHKLPHDRLLFVKCYRYRIAVHYRCYSRRATRLVGSNTSPTYTFSARLALSHDEVQLSQCTFQYRQDDRRITHDFGRLLARWSSCRTWFAIRRRHCKWPSGGGVPAGSAFSAVQAAAMGGPIVDAAVVAALVPGMVLL